MSYQKKNPVILCSVCSSWKMCRCSSQVSFACSAKHLEALLSAGAAENLSLQKSCWIQQGLALLTEAILMFYWFFDYFFSAPASTYTLLLHLCQEEQQNKQKPLSAFGPGPCVSTSGIARTSGSIDSWTRRSLPNLLFWWMISCFTMCSKGF